MDFTFDTRFQHPFTMILAGNSGSGKTFFTSKLIEDRVFPSFKKSILVLLRVAKQLF